MPSRRQIRCSVLRDTPSVRAASTARIPNSASTVDTVTSVFLRAAQFRCHVLLRPFTCTKASACMTLFFSRSIFAVLNARSSSRSKKN